jgi:uncharacterized membrane protein YhfC
MKVKIIGFFFFVLACLLAGFNLFVFIKAKNLGQGKSANKAVYLILLGIVLAVFAQDIVRWLSKKFFSRT